MNKYLPEFFLGKNQMFGTVTFSVLFAIVFLNIYIPFSDTAWFRLGDSIFFLFTAGFIFISLLILIASRILMYNTKKWFRMTYLVYVLWSIAEVVLICAFYTFVTIDVQKPLVLPPIEIFSKALLYGTIALIIPEILSGMYYALEDKNKTISLMNSMGVVTDEAQQTTGDGTQHSTADKISLCDTNGLLKFSVSCSNLYYIESDDNYINIWYTDKSGALKMYMLRCRLKTVEETFRDSPLMRCNRKYIVNRQKVKVLKKEKDGYVMELDNESIPPIPVTKTYLKNVLKEFSE
ncbi:MAG: LytR/AlgR family response regulator transcription factor [Candidatus Cryptobacteroides sp.]